MIKGIIFDIDNTLTDFMRTKRAAVDAAVEMMIDAGLPVQKDKMVDKIFDRYWIEGVEDQKIFNKVLMQEFGRIDIKILAAGIVGYRRAKAGFQVLYPNVTRTLIELMRMRILTTVLSDAPRLEVWLRIAGLGLHHYFDEVITAEDTGARKPDPKTFLTALKALGTKPEETLMVGDWAERDIAGAKGVGLQTAWAKYGDTFDTKESGADHDLNDIVEILDIVRAANSKEMTGA